MIPFQKYQQLIADHLAAMELPAEPKGLYEPLRYVTSLGGKRMRPVLVLAGCELFGGEAKNALPAAIAIELFHNFTLVHDDIMDQAPLRRNQPTVHTKWNVNTAILSGDVLLVKAYAQLALSPNDKLQTIIQVFNDTAVKVCEGQQLDMDYEKETLISLAKYIGMIELKTAVLLAGSLQIGALIGGARDEDARRIYAFGRNLGIAFQLQDDLLDVYGDQAKVGKQKGGDILANKKTFLMLKAIELSASQPYQKEALLNWLQAPASNDKVEGVTAIFDQLQIKAAAEAEMKKYYNNALANLKDIPLGEEKKKELVAFVDQLMGRES